MSNNAWWCNITFLGEIRKAWHQKPRGFPELYIGSETS